MGFYYSVAFANVGVFKKSLTKIMINSPTTFQDSPSAQLAIPDKIPPSSEPGFSIQILLRSVLSL